MSETFYRERIMTPLGPMVAIASARGLRLLEFEEKARLTELVGRLPRGSGEPLVKDQPDAVTTRTRRWLEAYFAGSLDDIGEVALDLGGTAFEQGVWQALLQLKPGETSTYGRIAARIGRPRAARAVGRAVGLNPVAVIVPCHRVVGASGALTGYGGGLDRKRWLLEHERARRVK